MTNELVLNDALRMTADFMKSRRTELGLTQDELADACGISRITISRFEQGKYWLNLKQYFKICGKLHLIPTIVGIESTDQAAVDMRLNWQIQSKALTLAEALEIRRKGIEALEIAEQEARDKANE